MICPFKRQLVRRGFTLVEVAAGIVILGIIVGSLLVSLNGYVERVSDHDMKMLAFEVARENMERLLSSDSVKDFTSFGFSQDYPEIEWETTVESFYEPITSRMWAQAICTASYLNSQEKRQEIKLTHWLTDVSKEQIKKIMEYKRELSEYEQALDESGLDNGDNPEIEPDERDPDKAPEEQVYCGKTISEIMQMPLDEIIQFLMNCEDF